MITSLEEVREGKLTWPDSKPRASHRVASQFETGLDRALLQIKDEMTRHGALDFIISRNNMRIFAGDPGVAVWWSSRRAPKVGPNLRVLACDKFTDMGSNARAIAATLEAMRALERWGAYSLEQASEGARIALPPPSDQDSIDWRLIFKAPAVQGLAKMDILDMVNTRYRRMAGEAAGDQDELRRLNLAIEKARKELTP